MSSDASASTNPAPTTLELLEKIYAESCHCKLREKCLDKNAATCLKHRNLYAEDAIADRLTQLNPR